MMMLVAVGEELIECDSKLVLCNGGAVQAVVCQSLIALEVAVDLSNDDVEIAGNVRVVVTKLDGESLAICWPVLDVFIVSFLTSSEATCDELDVSSDERFARVYTPAVMESVLATTEVASRTEVISKTEEDSQLATETGREVDSTLVTWNTDDPVEVELCSVQHHYNFNNIFPSIKK